MRRRTRTRQSVHVVRVDGKWFLIFQADEMKNHLPFEREVPAELWPRMERYLSYWRPMLLDGHYGGAELWISYRPRALTANGIYYAITTRTREA